ncbi:MAG: alpha-hydroxy-acid oxidizing protein [Methanosarcinales archaeon]|nr:alpha-hydroxy-acid oxidizing protein [Methanosarcinales archaeon]
MGEKYTARYLCTVCKIYIYDEKKGDPETNLAARTTFNNIPGTWRCPICGATRDSLKLIASDELNQVHSQKEEFTLVKVRNNALEKLAGLCGVYKVCDGNPTGGGVRTGFDVMKMLALGANGVLIGRDMIRAAVGGGPEGIKLHFDYLRSDLKRGMVMTGCKSIDDINCRIFDK